jgi:uncharacterized membrane protein
MLVVSFDEPGFNGEIIDEMRRLNDGGVIRLIDALAVQKNLDGTLTALQWSDLSIPDAEEYGATLGALLGLGMAGEEGMHAGAVVGAEAGSDGHVMVGVGGLGPRPRAEAGIRSRRRIDRTHVGRAAAGSHRTRRWSAGQ